MIPGDLIELQARLSQELRGPRLRRHAETMDSLMSISIGEAQAWREGDLVPPPATQQESELAMDQLAYTLSAAPTFHVSADMSEVMIRAARGLVEQPECKIGFPVDEQPTATGFVVFDKPTEAWLPKVAVPRTSSDDIGINQPGLIYAQHAGQAIRALAWAPGFVREAWVDADGNVQRKPEEAGLRITFFVEMREHAQWLGDSMDVWEERVRARSRKIRQRIAIVAAEIGCTLDDVAQGADDREAKRRYTYVPLVKLEGWKLDRYVELVEMELEVRRLLVRDLPELNHPGVSLGDQARHLGVSMSGFPLVPIGSVVWPRTARAPLQDSDDLSTRVIGIAWSFFYLARQTIAATEVERAPRATARRWRDMPLPKQVTVVKLRRASNVNEFIGERSVQWKHRWIVRGHWRMQPHGPGRTEKRPVWIHDYVKGPDGAPLMLTDKVYDLCR